MAVSIIGGPIRRRREGFAQDTYTQSTATADQSLSLDTDLSLLGMGTATGFNRNGYSLASGIEGQEKFILSTGTGEAKVAWQGMIVTGRSVLDTPGDFVFLRYFGGAWRLIEQTATTATAT